MAGLLYTEETQLDDTQGGGGDDYDKRRQWSIHGKERRSSMYDKMAQGVSDKMKTGSSSGNKVWELTGRLCMESPESQ